MTDTAKPMHTPLPWTMKQIIPQRNEVWVDDAQGQPVLLTSHATAEIIVRAVNSFEQMKEALEDIARQKTTSEWEDGGDDFEGGYDACIQVARAALKLAKGE